MQRARTSLTRYTQLSPSQKDDKDTHHSIGFPRVHAHQILSAVPPLKLHLIRQTSTPTTRLPVISMTQASVRPSKYAHTSSDMCILYSPEHSEPRTDCKIFNGIHTAGKTQLGGFQLHTYHVTSLGILRVQHWVDYLLGINSTMAHLGFLNFGYHTL